MFGKALTAAVCLAILAAPVASADDTDTQFIGEVSNYVHNRYLDPATIKDLVADGNKVCEMTDSGFENEALVFVSSKWDGDPIGFMQAATRAYCPQYLERWQGL